MHVNAGMLLPEEANLADMFRIVLEFSHLVLVEEA